MRVASWLVPVLSLVALGCNRAEDGTGQAPAAAPAKKAATPAVDPPPKEPKPESKPEPAPEPESKPKNEDTPPPEGWSRVELSKVVPGMTGTVDVPEGLAVEVAERQDLDAEGLEVEARGLRIGPPRGSGISLEAPAILVPRLKSADAMARFHGQFEHVKTYEFGPDHWAVVQQWRPGECMIHGWSAAMGLTCNVFQAPCDQMAKWAEICGTLRPGPAPNESPTTAKSAFPDMPEAAAEVAMTVARAIARNDTAMLLGTLGPKGVKIGKTQHTAESLQAELAKASVLKVVAPIYGDIEGAEGAYAWNGEGPDGTKVTVWFSTGYGEQPFFTLQKEGAGWVLSTFGVFDHGEP